jgi:hypothetical protein
VGDYEREYDSNQAKKCNHAEIGDAFRLKGGGLDESNHCHSPFLPLRISAKRALQYSRWSKFRIADMVGLLVYQCWKAKRVLFQPYCDRPSELFQAAAFWFRRSQQLAGKKAGAASPKETPSGSKCCVPAAPMPGPVKSPVM